MRTRLSLLAFALVACGNAAQSQTDETTFQSPECKVAFAHPAGWEVIRDATEGMDPCRLTVRPLDWQQRLVASDSVDLHSIVVQMVERGVWAQLTESGFRRHDQGWVVLGRQDLEEPADSIGGQGWTGLRGTATQGCYREEGGFAGLCAQPTALVGTADRSLMMFGGPQTEEVFDRILATIQFR